MIKTLAIRNATSEVSNDTFVAACVAFQQAKTNLASHLGGADLEKLDAVSLSVYDLANKALRRKMKEAPSKTSQAVQSGSRKPFRDLIAQAVQGRKRFTIPEVIEALKKRGTLPESVDLNGYIARTLSTSELFKRVDRGVYRFNNRRQLALKGKPKELPSTTP